MTARDSMQNTMYKPASQKDVNSSRLQFMVQRHLQPSSAPTALPPSGIGRDWGHVLCRAHTCPTEYDHYDTRNKSAPELRGQSLPMRPILIPARASALRADCAPGPGVLVLLPPVARSLMCTAPMPSSYVHTSFAALIPMLAAQCRLGVNNLTHVCSLGLRVEQGQTLQRTATSCAASIAA